MNINVISTPHWRTASFAHSAAASTSELSALEQHLNVCKQSCGRLFAIRRHAEIMHGFLASRFVTTLLFMTVLIGLSTFVF